MTTTTTLKPRINSYQKVDLDIHETLYQTSGYEYQILELPLDSGVYQEHQDILLHRALFGLQVYEREEVKAMHWEKKRRIKKVHARTTGILNIWKQELTIKYTTPIFDFILKNTSDRTKNKPGVNFLTNIRDCKDTDPEMENPFTFRELGITKDQIIDKLIEHRILPKHFRELNAPIVKQKT